MVTDPIADFLTRVRNASRAHKKEVVLPMSKAKKALAEILKKNHYIDEVRVIEPKGSFSQLVVTLKYRGKNPAITDLKRISKPGQRIYVDHDHIPFVLSGIGISIISTSQGVMTGREARKNKVGGELICHVW